MSTLNIPKSTIDDSNIKIAKVDQDNGSNIKYRIPIIMDVITDNSIAESYKSMLVSVKQSDKFKIVSLEKNNKISLVANAGITFSRGYNGGKISADLPYLGGELYYQISNKINIAAGAGWYSRSNIGYILSSTSTSYGFGKSETSSITSLDKIYLLEIPLKINYQLKSNHLIGLGGAYSIVIGGENRQWTNSTDYTPTGINSNEMQNIEQLGGFTNTYNNTLSVFGTYEYRYKRFGVEARYYYGLNDLTIDEKVKLTAIDRNSRFLITLKYLLLK